MVRVDKSVLMKILNRSRDLINSGWCQGAQARDSKGIIARAELPGAVSFDITGALFKVTAELGCPQTDYVAVVNDVFDLTRPYLVSQKNTSMTDWNDSDGRTKEEVVNFFNIAIASLWRS